MKAPNRDLLVLLKNEDMSRQAMEQEVECLNEILLEAESEAQFCLSHELVDRNKITSNPKKILKVIEFINLPAFRFLINKN